VLPLIVIGVSALGETNSPSMKGSIPVSYACASWMRRSAFTPKGDFRRWSLGPRIGEDIREHIVNN
jgi:hypothetical protein